MASAGNQAHRRVRLRLLLNMIVFFLKIQKANVFLASFILHRTGEILYAYTEPDIWFCRPPPRLPPINRLVRSPPNKNGPQNELHGRKHGPFGRNPLKQQDCKLELWLLSDRAILSTLTHMPPCPTGHNPDPVVIFFTKGGRAL